jgi:hypothetical protein
MREINARNFPAGQEKPTNAVVSVQLINPWIM